MNQIILLFYIQDIIKMLVKKGEGKMNLEYNQHISRYFNLLSKCLGIASKNLKPINSQALYLNC